MKKLSRPRWESRLEDCHRRQVEDFKLIMSALATQRDEMRGFRSDMGTFREMLRQLADQVDRMDGRLGNVEQSYDTLSIHLISREQALNEQWGIFREALPDAEEIEEQLEEIRQRLDRLENPPAA